MKPGPGPKDPVPGGPEAGLTRPGTRGSRLFRQVAHVFVRAVDLRQGLIELARGIALSQSLGEGLGCAEAGDAIVTHPLILGDDREILQGVVQIGVQSVLLGLFHEALHALAMLLGRLSAGLLDQRSQQIGVLLDAIGRPAQPVAERCVLGPAGHGRNHRFHLVIRRPQVLQFLDVEVLEGRHDVVSFFAPELGCNAVPGKGTSLLGENALPGGALCLWIGGPMSNRVVMSRGEGAR